MRDVNSFRIVWLSVAILVASACGSQGDSSPSGAAPPHERVGSSSAALGTCANGALSASLTSPQSPGPIITVTASSGTCTAPLYQFWIDDNSGGDGWNMVQDFSSSPTFTWDTSTAPDGTYFFQVLIKDSTSISTYDTAGYLDFTLQGAGGVCTGATMTASLASPQSPGPIVTLAGTGAACANPLYQFWIDDYSGEGGWQMVQDYGSSPTFSWNTSAAADGTYFLMVYIRDSTSNSRFDSAGGLTYTLQAGANGICTSATMTTSLPTPQSPGPTVTLTGSASTCANPVYQFWIDDYSGDVGWQMVQDYSSSPTYTWDTSAALDGTYFLQLLVRDSTSNSTFDTASVLTYTLQGAGGVCTSAGFSSDKSSPEPAGTTITFTGSSSTCVTPEYEYWQILLDGAHPWTIAQPWSTNPHYVWDTSTAAFGQYLWQVSIRDATSDSPFDTAAGAYFTIAPAGTCGNATISATPASPQTAGAQVTISGGSAECGSPLYEFWQLAPGSQAGWTIVQPWGASSTYAWNTTAEAAGSYGWQVWVKDASSTTATYDSSTTFNYEIDASNGSCANTAVTMSLPSPQGIGTAITITGTSTSCSAPKYEFWELVPGDEWAIVQPWSATSTLAWSTTSLPPGEYMFEVWTRDASSTQNYDSSAGATYTLR
jgi:hypothetical protein